MDFQKEELKDRSGFKFEKAIDPLGDSISSVELVRVSGSDLDVVNAARVSLGKVSTELDERDTKLIKFLMEHDHTSPFEHNQVSFRIKAPMYVVRQWMRHRMNSYNEISYRYVKAPLEFYTPSNWRIQDTVDKQASVGGFDNQELTAAYKKNIESAVEAYEKLLEAGVAREQARGCLPVCTYTEFIFTTNLHSLMHFMKLRIPKNAQWEIQVYARALLKLTLPHFPISLGEWQRKYDIQL
ncbi:FAD-dependent thymidylate synthase [bacterium]|jgi:thymidylate synthase (FAD)|nr:FAD-dependent thymidylate synthase [bacterium]MBT5015578.1 FAD-dependent thymidylate synthase [bacterium]